MPQLVDVPTHGLVEFPDSMDDNAIVHAIKTNLSPSQAQSEAQSSPSADLSKYISPSGYDPNEGKPLGGKVAPDNGIGEDLRNLATASPLDEMGLSMFAPTDQEAGAVARVAMLAGGSIPNKATDEIAGATADAVGGAAHFATTPVGIAAGGLSAAGATAAKLVGSAFTAAGLKHLPESAQAIMDAKGIRQTTAAIESAAMDTLAVLGGSKLALNRDVPPTPAEAAVSELLAKGHSPEDIQAAVEKHTSASGLTPPLEPMTVQEPRTETTVTTTGEPETPVQEGKRMVGNMLPRSTMKKKSGESGAVPIPLSPETIATLREHGAAIKDVISNIRKVQQVNDLDRATMVRNRKLQQSFQEASEIEDEILRVAPKQATQNAITAYREAKGDMATLQMWEKNAKSKWMRQMAKDAQNLTPEQKEVAKLAEQKYAESGAKGQAADVLGDLRDAYVQHQWKMGNYTSGAGGRGLATSARFQKARTFDTFFDGDQAGFTPKETAIGKLLPAYVDEMNHLIANREFISDINKGKSTVGTPLVSPSGRVTQAVSSTGDKSVLVKPQSVQWVTDPATGSMEPPNGYKVMADQPALRKWKWASQTEAGTPILMHTDLALHPEAYKRINAMVGESGIRKWAKSDATTPGGKLARSAWMVTDAVSSEIKKSMFGIGAPFHQVQEGTHAVGHGITPFGHEPIDLENNAGQIDSVENGGLMLLPERFSGTGYEEGLSGNDALIVKGIGKLGAPGRAVQKWGQTYQKYLFHDYIPRLKYATYKAALERNLNRFSREIASGSLSTGDVKMMTGAQVNAAYGHLNYALLDRGPNLRHAMQLGLLAPDFLEARGRFTAQALKSLMGSKAGHEQLAAIGKLSLYQAALAYTATKLGGGTYDPTRPFEVHIGDRKYTMRSVPEDLLRAFTDTRAFASARMSLPLSTTMQIALGVNYRGEKSTPTEALGDFLANTLPLMARQAPGISSLREFVSPSSRNDPVSGWEQLAGSAGLKIGRNSPIQHAYEMVGKWKDANGVEKDKGTYPISKYQQLRYALEDDSSRASDEYDKLVEKEGRAKVRTGFTESITKPWTGSAANDAKFRRSLEPDDRELLKLADDRRHEILRRFKELR